MATRADLNGLLSQIKTILDTANTTTASPIDLSANLFNKRVQKTLCINPEMIIPQASHFPLVTCYVAEKDIKSDDIAKDQLNIIRRSTVIVDVVGSVWNNNFKTNSIDPSSQDVYYLMENIELILRSDYNLSNKVNWQSPASCRYFTNILDEQAHLRSGILRLECEVFY